MNNETKEKIAAAYTVYSLLCPSDRVVISIDTFAEIFRTNYTALEIENRNMMELGETEKINQFTVEEADATLQKGMQEAEETLNDKEKQGVFLNKLKKKMKVIPMLGSVLSNVPTMFKLVNSYFKGEYEAIPRKQLLIIVSALTYLISPIDLIPDFIPVIGLIDDIAVISVCVKKTKNQLEKYLAWREENGIDNEED